MSEFCNYLTQWDVMMMNYCIWFNHIQALSQKFHQIPAILDYPPVKIEQPDNTPQKKTVNEAKELSRAKKKINKKQEKDQDFQNELEQNITKKTKLSFRKSYDNKNTETNVINQAFSFLLYPKKSQKFLQKLCQYDQQKVQVFYKYMQTVKKSKQKYVNKQYFKSLVHLPENSCLFQTISRSHKRLQILGIQQLRSIIRRLVFFFLRSELFPIIINNSKFIKKTHHFHMQKITQLKKIIYKNIQKSQDKDEMINQ